jgi:16S rRNA processing protein RimM
MSRLSTPENHPDNPDTGSPKLGEPAFLVVGRLRSSHGVKGEISMDILTDFPKRLKTGKQVYVGTDHRPLVISHVRGKNKLMLITFEGFDDCDQVNTLRNLLVYVWVDNLPVLPENEFYFHQLIGLNVIDVAGTPLGILEEVLETGANDVYVVRSPEGGEILLPAVDEVILNIDLTQHLMTVHPQEWL